MKKYFSRKFIMAVLGVASGISLGLIGQSEIWCRIAGFSLSIVCAMIYMVIEGKVDEKSVEKVFDGASSIARTVNAHENVVEAIEKIGDAVQENIAEKEDGVNT